MKKNLKAVTIFLVIALILFSLIGCDSYDRYYAGANWNAQSKEYVDEHCALYLAEIKRLCDVYELECSTKEFFSDTVSGGKNIEIYLYDDAFTLRFNFVTFTSIAYYYGELYYYGQNGSFGEYDDFSILVSLLNDFTGYAAYETEAEENHFERLYYLALGKEEGKSKFESYDVNGSAFYDERGDTEYWVNLEIKWTRDGNNPGYYYMAQFDDSIEKDSYLFSFKGILKGLI